MTKMKLCGLFRPCDIDAANELKPEYIGFVFAPKSRRYVTPEKAAELKKLLDPDIQAVGVFVNEAITDAESCLADYILLDSGEGTGTVFDWKKIQNIQRPYFLAGGLSIDNVENAVRQLNPYAVDVSSGIETDGLKDKTKMAAFVAAVRKEERL